MRSALQISENKLNRLVLTLSFGKFGAKQPKIRTRGENFIFVHIRRDILTLVQGCFEFLYVAPGAARREWRVVKVRLNERRERFRVCLRGFFILRAWARWIIVLRSTVGRISDFTNLSNARVHHRLGSCYAPFIIVRRIYYPLCGGTRAVKGPAAIRNVLLESETLFIRTLLPGLTEGLSLRKSNSVICVDFAILTQWRTVSRAASFFVKKFSSQQSSSSDLALSIFTSQFTFKFKSNKQLRQF